MTDRFLSTSLRRALERDIKAARTVAEDGVSDAIRRLGVAEPEAPAHLSEADKAVRRRLRAHARALGDTVASGVHTVEHLVEAAAYAQWHRRLFARFLAERGLLRHPQHGVSVTLDEAEELAVEEGFSDGWSAAEAYAAGMLPAVFQPDDPVLALVLAPEHQQALRKLVLGLDPETFQSDDALGWTYQFWRAAEKERVNKADNKIGARDLPAVTQLFTEPYMVKFLLHNTLGAWRAGKVLADRPSLATEAADEATLRLAVSLPGYSFDMLRFVRDGEDGPWRPAAGVFPEWPEAAASIRALDPCCGSGHFLTEMLSILAGLRAEEEGLTDADAVAAVLRDNLYGLEIDERCVQIGAFAVALTAWRIGGFQPFGPAQVHIAWVGAPPPVERAEFLALANGDAELRAGLAGLHEVFLQAPLLGSLIEPNSGDLMSPQRLGRIQPLLERLVQKTRGAEPERAEGAVAAKGMADAAEILSRRYTLVSTNVPFLGRGKQHPTLAAYLERLDESAKADLATAMLNRTLRLVERGGTTATVTPQSWLFMGVYQRFRNDILSLKEIDVIGALGSRAFETISGEVVNVALVIISNSSTNADHRVAIFDANVARTSKDKADVLSLKPPATPKQQDQFSNPDGRISLNSSGSGHETDLLVKVAGSYVGFQNGDSPRWITRFWEHGRVVGSEWNYFQTTTETTQLFAGRDSVLKWGSGSGEMSQAEGVLPKGREAWGKRGVIVRLVGNLPASLYFGDLYDQSSAAIVPSSETDISAIWEFCSSDKFNETVRAIDQALKVTNATLVKVPFDRPYWQSLALSSYPAGLPEPYSDDPTQWLYHGHPAKAETGTPLHVALARLAGYRWPAEQDPGIRLSADARAWISKADGLPTPDADGVLPLSAVATERPLAERLREYLNVAIPNWDEARLVREADDRFDKKPAKDQSLEVWVRERAFRQHCALFHDRPFLWHIWDCQKDGFAAFLYYHRLDRATLQKLTYTLLGAWIARRQAEKDERRVEAATILQGKLEAILQGEAPYDIFARWKPLAEQPVGWNPDLDDGVRMNVRPWVQAGILKEPQPKGIKWGVDRGKDVASAPWFSLDKGARNNDRHTTLAEKRTAREAADRKAVLV